MVIKRKVKIKMRFFDSHSHLNDEKFDNDREKIIQEINKTDVTHFITAGYNLESSKSAVELAKQYQFIYAIIGISPNDMPDNPQKEEKLWKDIHEIQEIIKEDNSNKIVAIGEIGLDYYWEKNEDMRKLQRKAFIRQIELANMLELPIVIHTRDAVMDTLEILKKYDVHKKGIFHCCPQNRELIKEGLKLGFYISFAGPITFKNSKNADEIIKLVPNDKILIETDSPYLAPEPIRGTRNDPRNVKYIAQKIAGVKNMTIEEIANITFNNTCRIFGINM